MIDYIDLQKPWDGEPWRVRARQYDSQETSGLAYQQLVEKHISRSDVSLFRTTREARDVWILWCVGTPEKVEKVELGGDPYSPTVKEAAFFCQRRAHTAIEAFGKNPLAEEFTQIATYEHGARIQPDGSIEVAS